MIENAAARLANWFLKNDIIQQKDIEIQSYGITAVICTTINYLVLLILAVLFHRLVQAIIFLVFYMLLRKYIGGWHASTPLRCTIFGTILLFVYMYLAEIIPRNILINLLLSAIAVSLVFLFSPAYMDNEYTAEQISRFRQKARITSFIMFATIILTSFLPWTFCSTFQTYASMGMVSALLTMLPVKLMQRIKFHKNQ